MITYEALGYSRARIDDEIRRVPVFAAWLSDPVITVRAQLPNAIGCPSCGRGIDLAHLLQDEAMRQPTVFSIGIRCAACGCVVRFDKTPEADRARLAWTKRFEKD
jgi:4-hydroxy-3-methylbut-2-en-1-yl diphosphate synthase IspG/GcpE